MNRRELKRKTKAELNKNNNYWRMTLVTFIYLIVAVMGEEVIKASSIPFFSGIANILYNIFVVFVKMYWY